MVVNYSRFDLISVTPAVRFYCLDANLWTQSYVPEIPCSFGNRFWCEGSRHIVEYLEEVTLRGTNGDYNHTFRRSDLSLYLCSSVSGTVPGVISIAPSLDFSV